MGSNSFPNVTQVTFVELPAVRNITMEEGSFGRVDNLVISSMLWEILFLYLFLYSFANKSFDE